MLRDHDIISVAAAPTDQFLNKELEIDNAGRSNSIEETAYLMLHDSNFADTSNLVVQLCGSCPAKLAQATTAVLDIYWNKNRILPAGIDLNLGCPQECASKEGFGAFLVETDPGIVISCIASMRNAIDSYHNKMNNINKPTLSAKIRLLDNGIENTIGFARKLKSAGIDFISIHCRHRADKHNGDADWNAGAKVVAALSPEIPIVLNGGISNYEDAVSVMEQTKCHAVMAATGYLGNHRCFDMKSVEPEVLALEYLDSAEQYPPPSYLYIQKHLRWIFRDILQPKNDPCFDKRDFSDYRVKLLSFLVRPYLRSIEQYRLFVALYVKLSSDEKFNQAPASIRHLIDDVTFGSVKKAGKIIRYVKD